MKKITTNRLLLDCVGPKQKEYTKEFSDYIDSIEEYKEKPNCGSCKRTLLMILLSEIKLKEKLKNIYGEETELIIPEEINNTLEEKKKSLKPDIIIKRLLKRDYEEYIKSFNPAYVRFIDTFDDRFNKEIVVTIGTFTKE